MVKLDIDMPTSCETCPFKGARLCYIATWLGTEYREVPEEGRAEWCPMREADRWIPVTERLPEDYTDVLVWFEYFRYGNYNRMFQTHGIGNYSKKYDSWTVNHESG